MVKNEHISREVDLKTLIVSSTIGAVISFAVIFCIGVMLKNGVIPAGKWEYISKLGILVGCIGASFYVRLKIRKNRFALSLLANLIMIAFMTLVSLMFENCEIRIWGILLVLIIALTVSFLCCYFDGMHNKRRKRR